MDNDRLVVRSACSEKQRFYMGQMLKKYKGGEFQFDA